VQVEAGVLGFRMEPREVLAYPHVLRIIGEGGLGIYATNPARSEAACAALGEWLETYPAGFVGAPHFVLPAVPAAGSGERRALERLMAHPGFFAVFSRHGGMGSARPYPHADLADWVRFALEGCGRDRVLWGSEFPVFLWRNESIGECLAWLGALVPGLGAAELDAFLGGNAERILFRRRPVPPRRPPVVPAWVERQFDRGRTVPLFPAGQSLPMPVYRVLLDRYLERVAADPGLRFEEFFRDLLAEAARTPG
jgi:hypothetical protein